MRIREQVPDASFAFESGTRFGYEPDVPAPGPTTTARDPALFTGPAEEIAHTEEFVKMLVQSRP